jgi:hypothetical protein
MSKETAYPLATKLEPDAVAVAAEETTVLLCSIAISLKRIADAVTGTSENSGVVDFLRIMASPTYAGSAYDGQPF